MLTGQNGILNKAQSATEEQSHGSMKEAIGLKYTEYLTEQHLDGLEDDFITYMEDKGYVNDQGVVNTTKLLGGKQALGNGTDTDAYVLEESDVGYVINYYGKDSNSVDRIIWKSSNEVSWDDKVEDLKKQISSETGDCMIDEDGNIMPINSYEYKITGEDTAIVESSEEDEYGYPTEIAYNGEILENGELEYKIPVLIKKENRIYLVDEIGDYTFYRCTGLTSVTIPNSVTRIGYGAFDRCTGLTSVTIPNSVTVIDPKTFYGCTGLTSVTIPNSVTEIEQNAFEGCTGLTSVTIPNSVTVICGYTFYGCTGLTSVTIPNSVTEIGLDAFGGCTGLTSVTIPNSVTEIGAATFEGCTGLTSVTIPNSVTEIGFWAFQGCTGLTSVTIPNSVTKIGENAFKDVPHIYYNGTATGSPWGAKAIN